MNQSICIDARLLFAPGIGTYLKNLFRHFSNTPWKWYALVHPQDAQLLLAYPYITPLYFSPPIYSLREQLAYPYQIPSVDLFWSVHYNVPILPIRPCKRLTTLHDVAHLALPLPALKRGYAQFMIRRALHLSDHIITVSDFSKREIECHTGKISSPISVIALGVDHARFYPLKKDDSSILQRYGIKAPFLLYVGSLKKHKNIKTLVAAFSYLISHYPFDLQLVIVGNAERMRDCEDVKQLYTSYPAIAHRLRHIGYVPDGQLPSFYQQAELFLFASFYEGFGLPALEAMSCGCPVVAAHAGSLPEVCGQAACYIDPHSPQQIAERLAYLLSNKAARLELSQKGVSRSRDFCWSKCADLHCEVIERLLN